MLYGQNLRMFLRAFRSKELYQRNFGLCAVAFNKVDPIQKLFLNQVNAYKALSEEQGGGPVDVDESYEKKKGDAIARLANAYNIGNPNEFPTFKFQEPDLTQDDIPLES